MSASKACALICFALAASTGLAACGEAESGRSKAADDPNTPAQTTSEAKGGTRTVSAAKDPLCIQNPRTCARSGTPVE